MCDMACCAISDSLYVLPLSDCISCCDSNINSPKKRITRNHTQPSWWCERDVDIRLTFCGMRGIIASPVHIIERLMPRQHLVCTKPE